MSVEKYDWAIQKGLVAYTNQDSTFSHTRKNSKMLNIISKYFSFFNNKPPAIWVADITRDVIPVRIIGPRLKEPKLFPQRPAQKFHNTESQSTFPLLTLISCEKYILKTVDDWKIRGNADVPCHYWKIFFVIVHCTQTFCCKY